MGKCKSVCMCSRHVTFVVKYTYWLKLAGKFVSSSGKMDQQPNLITCTRTHLIISIVNMAYKGFKTASQFGFLSLPVKVEIDSNSVITASKGPNKLCRYKRVSLKQVCSKSEGKIFQDRNQLCRHIT